VANLVDVFAGGETVMRNPIVRLVALCALAALAAASPALAANKHAFVVGIDRYDSLPAERQLRKAVSDAVAVGAALRQLGYQVSLAENADRLSLVRQWQLFLNRIEPGDVAAFFFAGHGVEIGGVNYLLPRDVPRIASGEEEVLKASSLALSSFLEQLREKKPQLALHIVDACRDNPFVDARGRSIGTGRGLSRIDPPRGTFVMFSAGAGQSALDRLSDQDADPNSVYTRTLLRHMARPGTDLPEIARAVRSDVLTLARSVAHDQVPAYYDEVIGRFCPAGCDAPGAVAPPGPQPDPAAQAWAVTQHTTSTAVLEEFIRRFGDSFYATLARARLEELKKSQVAVVAPPMPPAVPPGAGATPAVGVYPEAPKPGPGVTPLSVERERALRPKDTFKECDGCPEMIVVPSGQFTMGSPAFEHERSADEGPQHVVTIGMRFAVGKFAVTFDEWDACVADGGCEGYRPADQGWGRGRRPVINVSWDDAQAYLAWVSRRTGKTYRLLSEAEREYVARGDTTTPFWWGSSINPSQANYDGTIFGTKVEYRKRTLPVDSFAPNSFGLYQVHGNVWEWTQDCWNGNYNGAPTDGKPWTTGDCSRRVLRGGSWFSLPRLLRAANRFGNSAANRFGGLGFRLARTLTP
jgi:formylglycine-generating enzyme required for sulfatase activity